MEDSIGTIFYIILMILVLGASLLKKKKRSQKPGSAASTPAGGTQSKPSTGQRIENIFSDFLKDQFPEAVQEEEFPEIFEEIEVRPEVKKPAKTAERATLISNEGQSVFNLDDPNTPTIETGIYNNLATADKTPLYSDYNNIIQENEIGKTIEEFDLKKAIIYSEIIKPKYFKIQEEKN